MWTTYLIAMIMALIINPGLGSDGTGKDEHGHLHGRGRQDTGRTTEIAPDPVRTLLLVSTLDGSLTAIGRLSGHVRWVSKDKPMIRVPTGSQSSPLKPPHFLPDPRSGSLYLLGRKGHLKKLPFTIPQLVSMAPCRSSEGLLYTGRKMDLWLSLDPLTGEKEEIFSFGDSTCPIKSAEREGPSKLQNRVVQIGKSEYTISMVDGHKKWNVTFHDYSSIDMLPQHALEYELVHFTSPSTGNLMTYDKNSGELLWQIDLQSPVIALYSIDPTLHNLISVPFTSVAAETLERIKSDSNEGNDGKLLPTLYVGECPFGFYAVSSLVDNSVLTISDKPPALPLLEGPSKHYSSESTETNSENLTESAEYHDFVILGHYEMPASVPAVVKQLTSLFEDNPFPAFVNLSKSRIIPPQPDPVDPVSVHNVDLENMDTVKDTSSGTAPTFPPRPIRKSETTPNQFPPPPQYPSHYHRSGEKEKPYIIMTTAFITVAIMTTISTVGFLTVRKFQWKKHMYPVKYLSGPNGIVTVGKINFDTTSVLGKGCEGTFVYKGKFENRDVAVKRILPECFEFADREVDLLKESDQHANVIRYFCTETDGQFRYIALELCAATLCDWVEGRFVHDGVQPMQVLREATEGLAYLHTLRIVHRDVKPANVLLSVCANTNSIKTMISDFGLCKKLQTGRVSFSRRSGGIPGTEGWIAPEMLRNSARTTCAVDVFSLGCVYYYVLSKGDHPFGDAFRRQSNIASGQFAIGHNDVTTSPQGCTDLIECMLSIDAGSRPTLPAVLSHPLFWLPDRILTFFLDVSDRIEKEEEANCSVLRRLENEAHLVVRHDWREWICDEVKNDLRKYRTYKGSSVRDLLRALRNKKNHYRELTETAQKSLGHIPDQFVAYWILRFPNLLPYTWKKFETLKDEPIFSRYYSPSYTWNFEEEEDHIETLSAANDSNWRNSSILSSSPEGDVADGSPPRQKNKAFWRPKNQQSKYKWRKPTNGGGGLGNQSMQYPRPPSSPLNQKTRIPTVIDEAGSWRSNT